VNNTRRNEILALCQRAKAIGLYGFILFLPISIALTQASLGLLFLTYLAETVLTKTFRFPATPLNRPLLAYVVITMIITIFSVHFLTSVDELRTIVVKVAVFYLFYLYIQDIPQLKRSVAILILAVTLSALYGILQHYLEVDFFRLTKPIALLKHVDNDLKAPVRIPGFSSYMTFSGQLAMMIPIICALLFAVKTKYKKGILIIAMILTFLALLWTYTRSAWIGAVCALILLGYVRGKRLSILFLLLLILPGIIIVQPDIFHRSLSVFRAKENMERLYTWESTLYMIKDHLLTGIGKGNYSQLAPEYRKGYNFNFTSRAHAHNNILQVTVEGGMLSLLCFLWLWFVMFKEMDRTYLQIPEGNSVLKWLSLGLLGAIVAFFVQGFFEHNFGDSETVMMMWFITALSLKLQAILITKQEPNL
jgi:O-antigen ligase